MDESLLSWTRTETNGDIYKLDPSTNNFGTYFGRPVFTLRNVSNATGVGLSHSVTHNGLSVSSGSLVPISFMVDVYAATTSTVRLGIESETIDTEITAGWHRLGMSA